MGLYFYRVFGAATLDTGMYEGVEPLSAGPILERPGGCVRGIAASAAATGRHTIRAASTLASRIAASPNH
jgi:hypothetical protein